MAGLSSSLLSVAASAVAEHVAKPRQTPKASRVDGRGICGMFPPYGLGDDDQCTHGGRGGFRVLRMGRIRVGSRVLGRDGETWDRGFVQGVRRRRVGNGVFRTTAKTRQKRNSFFGPCEKGRSDSLESRCGEGLATLPGTSFVSPGDQCAFVNSQESTF
jgi:hypothetical protein